MKIEIGVGSTALTEIAALIGHKARLGEKQEAPIVTHIATDSREVSAGTLFLGIRGERVDGNDYCEQALADGAAAVLCEKAPKTGAAIVTDDTVLALGTLANAVRQGLSFKTVAVTGSVGKTTTKDLISLVLSQKYKTHSSKGNFNSNIGLPMSILAAPADTECGVFELGMSAFLEIDYLSRLVRPDIGVITNIGTSHMESLGSRENIAKAKLELLNGMKAGSIVLLNGDDALLRAAKETAIGNGIRPIYVSVSTSEDFSFTADFRAENVREEIGQTIFDLCFGEMVYRDLKLSVMGIHSVYAALFASATGVLLGVSEEEIRRGLLSFTSAPMRQSIESIAGITLIEDCYNASPESMRAALDVAKTIVERQGSGRLIALLGDMRELGEASGGLHEEVGRYAKESGVKKLFTFGEIASVHLLNGALQAGFEREDAFQLGSSKNPTEIAEVILPGLQEGDVVLVKASRALRAEHIVSVLRERLSF